MSFAELIWVAKPTLAPATFGLLLLAFVPFLKDDRRWLWGLSVLGMIVSAGVPIRMLLHLGENGGAAQGMGANGLAMVRVDLLSLWLDVLFNVAGLLALLLLPSYLERARAHHPEVYPLLFFAVAGMTVMVGTENLLMMFIGLEVLSIPLYVLCGLTRERTSSLEAALKYFLLGAFSTGFLVFGIALVMGASGHLDLPGIAAAVRSAETTGANWGMLAAGLGMLIVALGFKVAVIPFHAWAPDVYQGAPTPITAFMAAGTKAAAFGVLLRVLHTGFTTTAGTSGISGRWIAVLGGIAILTMVGGNLLALVQQRIKRLLAYSSIANAGYLTLALLAPLDVGAGNMVFYLLAYTFMTIGAFAVVALFQDGGEDADHIDNFKGLWQRRPLLALAMMVFLLSLTGIPPTGGFTGKYVIFMAALDSGHGYLAAIMALSAVIGAAYYLRVVVAMFFEEPSGEVSSQLRISPPVALAVCIAAFMTLALGVAPNLLLSPLSRLHESLFSLL